MNTYDQKEFIEYDNHPMVLPTKKASKVYGIALSLHYKWLVENLSWQCSTEMGSLCTLETFMTRSELYNDESLPINCTTMGQAWFMLCKQFPFL